MRKIFILLSSLSFISFFSTAQDYKVNPPDSLRFYLEPLTGVLKGYWFDSVSVNGSDTTFINRGQFESNTTCWIRNAAPFFGHQVIVQPSGRTLFFNNTNDSIKVETQASVGTQWDMCNFSNGSKVVATVISVDTLTWKNGTDSVKNIQMTFFDSTGVAVNFPVADSVFSISKSNGIMNCPDMTHFPIGGNYLAQPVGIFTNRDRYNCLQGDTIQIYHSAEYGGHTYFSQYFTKIIDTVYYSAGSDTIFFGPTEYYTDLNRPLINAYPDREIIPGSLNYYELQYSDFCGHPILTLNLYSTGFATPGGPCDYSTFEEGFTDTVYYAGMIEPLDNYSEGSACTVCNHRYSFLTYFSRAGWTCAEFSNFFDAIVDKELYNLVILTNNSAQYLQIKNADKNFEGEFAVFDYSGKMLLNENLHLQPFEEMKVNTSHLSDGLYLFSYTQKGELPRVKRFVK